MSGVFIDTNIFVYATASDDTGEACREALERVARGELEAETSTAVLEELWHLELSGRIDALSGQTARAHRLLAPVLAVDDAIFRRALHVDAPSLGANDRIHFATCAEAGLDRILSFDRGFDSVEGIERVDPLG